MSVREFLLVILLLAAAGSAAATGAREVPLRNVLDGSPSRYLAMHATDPVHWQRWGEAVFARARREHKLVYVASGYYACHWCHVMDRESYRDRAIAAVLNREYIPVQLDRELNPALDARLIDFTERTRGQGGWPLAVFVTPDGYPLLGTLYLPPKQLQGLLNRMAARWRADGAHLSAVARGASIELSVAEAAGGARLSLTAAEARRLRAALIRAALNDADEFQGGFGDQNKFPMAPQLDALLAAYRATGDARLGHFLRLTLDHMARGGLRDQLAGGFFRYTVDPGWQVPHFEKMLYDNALLARLYLRAGDMLAEPRYTAIGRETLDFMLHVFGSHGPGFAASLSAVDAHGVAGGAYLWQRAQVRALLTPGQYRVVAPLWGLDGPPTLEDGYHLAQVRTPAALAAQLRLSVDTVRSRVAAARARLLAARGTRRIPRDDKRVAAWNGLALSALVAGARRFPHGPYRAAAARLARFLGRRLWDGRQLHRAMSADGRLTGTAALGDYAYVAAGLLDWARLSGDAAARGRATALVDAAWRRFRGPGGWRLGEVSLLRYGAGEPVLADGPTPSPSAVLVRTTLALADTGTARRAEVDRRREARTALRLGGDLLHAAPLWHATEIATLTRYLDHRSPATH